MIKELIQLANHLDSKGFVREANYLDSIIKKASDEDSKKEMAEEMAKRGDTSFFEEGLDQEYPELVGIIAEKLAQDGNQALGSYEFEITEVLGEQEFLRLKREMIEKLVENRDEDAYIYKNKYPDLIQKMERSMSNMNPSRTEVVNRFKQDPDSWRYAQDSFIHFARAKNDSDMLKTDFDGILGYYPGWKPSDFKYVLDELNKRRRI